MASVRWIKHMTATRQDEKIAAYLELCGPKHRHEGYGMYWAVLETVAAGIEKSSLKCSATYPVTMWSRLLYSHHHTVGKYLGNLEVTGLVTLMYHEGKLTVTIPNLLKYRDEYSKKSGHCQESVRTKIQNTDTDRETETNTEQSRPVIVGSKPKLPPPDPIWGEAGFGSSENFEAWWVILVAKHPNRNRNAVAKSKAIELVLTGVLKREEFESGYAINLEAWAPGFEPNLWQFLDDFGWRHAPRRAAQPKLRSVMEGV